MTNREITPEKLQAIMAIDRQLFEVHIEKNGLPGELERIQVARRRNIDEGETMLVQTVVRMRSEGKIPPAIETWREAERISEMPGASQEAAYIEYRRKVFGDT